MSDRQRLLGGERRGNHALVDRAGDDVHEGDDPEQPGPLQADVPAEPQDDGSLPLLRDARGEGREDADDRSTGHPRRRSRGGRQGEADAGDQDEEEDGHDVEDHDDAPFEIVWSSRRRSAAENPWADASARARVTMARSSASRAA